MNNTLSLTFVLTLLLLAIWFTNCALDTRAEWELILDENVYSIASDGERLYAGTEDGIYYSRDDGDTWQPSDFDGQIHYLTGSPSAVYGYHWEHGILRSVTKGNTWHWTNKGFGPKSDGHDLYYPFLRQFLITSSGMVIAVCYGSGTWISRDRGDSWHEVTHEWTLPQSPGYSDIPLGTHIWSMGEHDDHLWAIYSSSLAARSPDEGATWQLVGTIEQFARVEAWVSYRGHLYVGGYGGFGRFREEAFEWEALSHGLPQYPRLEFLVVHRDRIFGGSYYGLFMFDHHAETWYPAGLPDLNISGLVSHRGNLYASGWILDTDRDHKGLYRAKRLVYPEGKTPATWGKIKSGGGKK